MVRLREYYCDANAPRAHDVLPAAFAEVRNSAGELLLVRRIDDGNWELPGGRIEVGESVSEAVVREVAEESGITIVLVGFAGVYSDPSHVLVDPGGSIHQQLAQCFHAVPAVPDAGTQPRPDGIETNAAAWYADADIVDLRDAPSDATTNRQRPSHASAALHYISIFHFVGGLGPDERVASFHQVGQPSLLGQPHHRDQTRQRHDILRIERGIRAGGAVQQSHLRGALSLWTLGSFSNSHCPCGVPEVGLSL